MGKTYKIGDFITVEELDDENNSNKEVSLKEDNGKDIIIDSSKFKGKELKYYQNNLQGKIVHHPVLGDIHLGKKGRKETLFRCRGQYLAVLCFIDKIIETGYSNGQPEDLEHSRNDDIYQFFRIYNTVIFNGKLLGVNVLIGEDFQGKKYYMFKTEDYSLDEKIEINPSLNRKEANRPKPSQEAYNLIIKNKNKNVKSFVTKSKDIKKIEEIKEDMKILNVFKKLNEELKPLLEENITINTEQTSDPIILDIAFEDKYDNGKGRYISGLHVGDRLTVRMKGLSNFDVKGFKIIEIDDKKAKLLHPKYTEEDGNLGRVYIIDLNNVEINMGEEIRFRPLDKTVDSWFAVLHVHRKDIDKLMNRV